MCVCLFFHIDEMEWMAELCGAAVVNDPLLFDQKQVRERSVQWTVNDLSPIIFLIGFFLGTFNFLFCGFSYKYLISDYTIQSNNLNLD